MRYIIFACVFLICTCCYSQHIQLSYAGKNKKLKAAVAEANKLLLMDSFYRSIDSVPHFDNSSYTGSQISNEFKTLNRVVIVRSYWNPLGIANAKTVNVINLNTAKLGRSTASVVNTIIHEAVHAVDWWTNNLWDYTHDGNSPEGQDATAPWIIGAIAERMVSSR